MELLGLAVIIICLLGFIRGLWKPRENIYAERDQNWTDGGQG